MNFGKNENIDGEEVYSPFLLPVVDYGDNLVKSCGAITLIHMMIPSGQNPSLLIYEFLYFLIHYCGEFHL